VNLGLQAGSVGAADAHPAYIPAVIANIVDYLLNAASEGKSAPDAGNLFLFVKFKHYLTPVFASPSVSATTIGMIGHLIQKDGYPLCRQSGRTADHVIWGPAYSPTFSFW
jgi:hypothetical protein